MQRWFCLHFSNTDWIGTGLVFRGSAGCLSTSLNPTCSSRKHRVIIPNSPKRLFWLWQPVGTHQGMCPMAPLCRLTCLTAPCALVAPTFHEIGPTYLFLSGELKVMAAACPRQHEVSRELANCPGFLRKSGERGARQLFYTLSCWLPSCTMLGHRECHLCALQVWRFADAIIFQVRNSEMLLKNSTWITFSKAQFQMSLGEPHFSKSWNSVVRCLLYSRN